MLKKLIFLICLLYTGLSSAKAGIYADAYILTDASSGLSISSKNAHAVKPIASITKLMTAMVIIDELLPEHELLKIIDDDVDHIKHSSSRLYVGTLMYRDDMLRLALMASENRAAHALARTSKDGLEEFVNKMNQKAKTLGMHNTRFVDPTGLSEKNVSTAADISRLVMASSKYKKIKEYSTFKEFYIQNKKYSNTNPIVRESKWPITVSKTGFTKEAGRCVAMRTSYGGKDTIMVILDSPTKETRIADANRLKLYLSGDQSIKSNKKYKNSKV